MGDTRVTPRVVVAGALDGRYDAVMLACKAYDLPAAIAAVEPAFGPATVLIPLLNGVAHLDRSRSVSADAVALHNVQ